MKQAIHIAIAFVVIGLTSTVTSCNKESGCDSCDLFEIPDSLALEVNVTINDYNPYVPIVIFDGDFDDGDTVLIDTMYLEQYYYYLPVNNRYSVTAKYQTPNETIIAVDGDRVTYVEVDDCEYDCWADKDASVDLKLD